MSNNLDYDYIIVGSGFGGAVSALRLSEKGYKVLVIEKGKWYNSSDFPKTNWNLPKWFWMPIIRFKGIMKMTIFRHVVILSGVGVGGGSLVYANTLPIPKGAFYKSGSWSELADWQKELEPYYKKALQMLGATENPRLFDGDKILKDLAKKLGREEFFERPDVAIFFGEENKTVEDPYFNGEGPERSGCTFCGGCMTGCRNNAKNSLDKNYLYLAQKKGAEILAENEVYNVSPIDDNNGESGYSIDVKSSTKWFKKKQHFTAKGVIFAGGVLGSVPLLLKMKKKKSLPNLSDKVGYDIRTNNETLVSVSTLDDEKDLSKGIAIGSLLHTDDNSHLEVVRYAEGSNFWKILHLPYGNGNNVFSRVFGMTKKFITSPLSYLKIFLKNSWAKKTAVLLFMQTVDSTLRFKLNIFGGLTSSVSTGKKPTPNIPESIELTNSYSDLANGKASSFILEVLAGIPSTAHILGGAVMGSDKSQGVINKNNEVFGYKNMLVVDGSMISANPGVNPSLTITALAERAMEQIPAKE